MKKKSTATTNTIFVYIRDESKILGITQIVRSTKLSVTLDTNYTVTNTENTAHTAHQNMNIMSNSTVNQHMPQANQLIMLLCSVHLSLHADFPFTSFTPETKVTSRLITTISRVTSKDVKLKIQNCSQHSQLRRHNVMKLN